MNIKTKYLSMIFIILFALGMGFPLRSVFAETSPDQCPASNPEGTVDCTSGNYYAGSLCRSASEIQGVINTCLPAGNKEYSCASNTCVCKSGFCANGATCQTPVGTAACDALNKSTADACTGTCGGCKSGFELSGALCVASCAAGSLRTSAGCISMETVASLLSPILGTTMANLTTQASTILANITANKSYYFLAPTNATGTEYKYGSGVDTTNKWRVEADWADQSWLAQYLNWNNEPAKSIMTAFGAIFCTTDAQCGGAVGSCLPGGICTGSVTGVVGGGGGGATWAGFTALTYNGARTNYATANGLCNTNFAGSHVCTSEEMLSIIKSGGILPADGTRAWVNSGPPGYTAAQANDCAGWTTAATDSYGRYWWFIANSSGWLANCSNTYKFACCK